ncbi:MAG: aminopeptidase P family protein [Candidatus Saccharimonadales bacterium]
MESFFTAEFFVANRQRLRSSLPEDTMIVVSGNGLMQRAGDTTFPFRQDSNFWYLTGLDKPDLTLVITNHQTFVIAPALSFVRAAFDGTNDFTTFKERSGVDQVVDERQGWAIVKSLLANHSTVAALGSAPEYIARNGFYTSPARRRLIAKLKRLRSGVEIKDIRPQLAAQRCIKQPPELKAMQRAIDITSETIAEIRQPESLASIKYEYELEAAINYGFRRRGALGPAFDSVVAAGSNATTLHHTTNDGLVQGGDMVVVDIGAEVEYYAADITRTISSRPLAGRQADVYQAVLEVQNYAFGQIKPGVMPRDFEAAIEFYMGQKLKQLGIIQKVSRDDIRRYFPHATSHFLGLDAHDVGDYRQPYQAGMVITVEPGIYVPEEAIGVRIEDDVLITSAGIEILSQACPS